MYMHRSTTLMVVALMAIISNNVHTMSWEDLFEQKDALFKKYPRLEIIKRQQAAYKAGTAPAIAHPDVKRIPIHECGEVLVDVRDNEKKISRISMMPNPATPFASDACNSGLPSASKIRASVYSNLVVKVTWLDELAREYGYERGQISIKVFEGLRDLKTQEMLFNNKKKAIMAATPDMSDADADAETSKWVSPVKNNVPVHSTGAAVDLRLWDEKNKAYLDAGKFGVIWGDNPSAPTFSEDITDAQKSNRLYSLMACVLAGCTNYPNEWWHEGFGDRVDEFWKKDDPDKRVALYGSVK